MANLTECVTLGLGEEVFGIPVENVREILDMRRVARLPHAPDYLLGITDVRGCSVPVVDLRIKLGLPPAPTTSSTRIIVLEVGVGGRLMVLGLVADRVFEVASLDSGQIEPPPGFGFHGPSDYITGIGRRGDCFVIVFNPTRLFASDERVLARSPANAADEA